MSQPPPSRIYLEWPSYDAGGTVVARAIPRHLLDEEGLSNQAHRGRSHSRSAFGRRRRSESPLRSDLTKEWENEARAAWQFRYRCRGRMEIADRARRLVEAVQECRRREKEEGNVRLIMLNQRHLLDSPPRETAAQMLARIQAHDKRQRTRSLPTPISSVLGLIRRT